MSAKKTKEYKVSFVTTNKMSAILGVIETLSDTAPVQSVSVEEVPVKVAPTTLTRSA